MAQSGGRPGLSNAWPAMLSRVARVEIKVAEKLYRRTQRAFSLICWSSLEPLNAYIVSCYNVKDVHYSFSKNIHLHKITYYV